MHSVAKTKKKEEIENKIEDTHQSNHDNKHVIMMGNWRPLEFLYQRKDIRQHWPINSHSVLNDSSELPGCACTQLVGLDPLRKHNREILLNHLVWDIEHSGASMMVQQEIIHLQCRRCRCGFYPWIKKMPWKTKWQPGPVFYLKKSMDGGHWWATVHGVTNSRTQLSDWALKNNSQDFSSEMY